MVTILGLEPIKIIVAITALSLVAVLFTVLLSGPSTIMDGAFNVLTQTVTSAQVSIAGLMTGAAGIVTQGMGAAASAVAEATMMMGQSTAAAVALGGNILEAGAALTQAAVQFTGAIVAAGAQVIAGAAAAGVQMVSIFGITMSSLLASVAQTAANVFSMFAEGGLVIVSNMSQLAVNSIAQLWTTMFTSIAGAVGQLLSIPMIVFFGFVSVSTAMVSVIPAITTTVINIFMKLFNMIVGFFTDPEKLIKTLGNMATTLGGKILEGFTNLINNLGTKLKEVFFP